ncbi:hypothetical protein [Halorubrum sp. Atlit-26R]|uniref:hypothetical protein n=1 Tax=Halorubrum sp. Atlit-26R TaxID=2282128 RepID=UPI0018F2E284|nr:hypothetical protein [Halorubrum sp. Atlit-26R]
MTDDEMGHASSVAEQLRQAEENDEIPESSADRSSIRLAVDGELLDPDNPIDYLVMLLLEGKRYDGAWDGDQGAVAKYAIATWCQEIGWAPDLTGYDAGEVVSLGDEIPYCNAAFYGHAGDEEAATDIDMVAVDEALEPVDVEAQDIIDEVDDVQEGDDVE